jgi:hypothetical protein
LAFNDGSVRVLIVAPFAIIDGIGFGVIDGSRARSSSIIYNYAPPNAHHCQPKRYERKYYHRHSRVAPGSVLCIIRHRVRAGIGRHGNGLLLLDRSDRGRSIGPRHGWWCVSLGAGL